MSACRKRDAGESVATYRREAERLRRELAGVVAELKACRRRQKWMESALAAQRHARQVLEAAVSANYAEAVVRIREVVRAKVPSGAIVLVVSRGDNKLLKLAGREGWHFPQGADGQYAGCYPADSKEAIAHLKSLIAKGARFLLFPGAAFWWLQHYRGLADYLAREHDRVWSDDLCGLYRLSPQAGAACGHARLSAGSMNSSAYKAPLAAGGRRAAALPRNGRVAKRSGAGRYDVVCFPIINWDSRFQRPQQLMLQFAAAGHRVFYLSHEFRKSAPAYAVRRRAARLYEVSLQAAGFKVHQGLLDDDSRRALFRSLSALCRECSLGPAALVVQLPFWWPLVREVAAAFACPVVYDCMDLQAGFSTSHPLLVEQEVELMSAADLVVTSSEGLEAEARRHSRNVVLVRNACDYGHFSAIKRKRPGMRPVIGYFGAIAEWFDSDLVAGLAERRPDWDVILVGSTACADIRRLSKLSNVSLPGEKPYAEIPDWLARFDVAILPFKRTALTEAVNPVKAYEILAAGKPLVSVPLPEMRRLAPLARLASTAAEFEREIERALRQPDRLLELRRRSFAGKNTWRARFEALAPALRALFRGEKRTQPGGET